MAEIKAKVECCMCGWSENFYAETETGECWGLSDYWVVINHETLCADEQCRLDFAEEKGS